MVTAMYFSQDAFELMLPAIVFMEYVRQTDAGAKVSEWVPRKVHDDMI